MAWLALLTSSVGIESSSARVSLQISPAAVKHKSQPYFFGFIVFLGTCHSLPAIVWKTPAEFKIFLHKPFWGGVARDRLELVNQSRLMFILIKNEDEEACSTADILNGCISGLVHSSLLVVT